MYFNAIDVLGAYGLTEDDIKPTYQSFSDSADALKNGQIDAAFIVAGAPTTAVTDLATTKDTYLVSLDSEHIAKLLETSDYYTETVPRNPLRERQNKRGAASPLFCRLLSSRTARRPPHRRNAEFSRAVLQGAARFAIMVPSRMARRDRLWATAIFC